MGRKGLGKLALFALADKITLISKTQNSAPCGFILDYKEIGELPKTSSIYHPKEAPHASKIWAQHRNKELSNKEHGTLLILEGLEKIHGNRINNFKRKVARRFTIIGEGEGFSVFFNNEQLDSQTSIKFRFVWKIGDCENAPEGFEKNKQIDSKSTTFQDSEKNIIPAKLSGWIGAVYQPKDLKGEDGNLNLISLFVRGKLTQEDLLSSAANSGHWRSYQHGQIHADFLDVSSLKDLATTSRQGIVAENERSKFLTKNFLNIIKEIEKDYQEWSAKEVEESVMKIQAIKKWLNGKKGDTQSQAKDFIVKVAKTSLGDKEQLASLVKFGIIAFEYHKSKDSLKRLKSMSKLEDNGFVGYLKAFDDISQLESALHYQTIKARLNVIENLKHKLNSTDSKEAIYQGIIKDNLWIINPSWDLSNNPENQIEVVLKKALNKIDVFVEDKDSRLDIRVPRSNESEKDIVIELKRPSVPLTGKIVVDQIRRYSEALDELKNNTRVLLNTRLFFLEKKLTSQIRILMHSKFIKGLIKPIQIVFMKPRNDTNLI